MKGFLLDPLRCTGCEACRVACAIENRLPMERAWRTVHHANPWHLQGHPSFHLSIACNHCARPACMDGCPASAYARDPGTGAVLLDPARCIGCRYCAWQCPYDAPVFDAGAGVMGKCTFCADRLREGRAPSCATACPTGALGVEEAAEPRADPDFPGLYPGGLGPALRIAQGPRPAAPAQAVPPLDGTAPRPAAPSGLGDEWTLWVFTLLGLGLVGLHLGWTLGGPLRVPPWGFLAVGVLAAGLSTAHLGRPERAWRALGNLRSSWLSREILGFSLFLPAAAWAQSTGVRGPGAWLGAGLGLLFLIAVDRLYQVAERRPWWRMRSAEALPAGLQVAALVAGWIPAYALLGLARCCLFLVGDRHLPLPAAARLAALSLPLVAAAAPLPPWAVLAGMLAGEALDRAGFYARLQPPGPSSLLGPPAVISGCGDPA